MKELVGVLTRPLSGRALVAFFIFRRIFLSVVIFVWFSMIFHHNRLAVALLAVGAICNTLAVAANRGLMPVRNGGRSNNDSHQPMTGATRFKYLCDIWLVRIGRGRYCAVSVGDVLVLLSVVAIVFNPHV